MNHWTWFPDYGVNVLRLMKRRTYFPDYGVKQNIKQRYFTTVVSCARMEIGSGIAYRSLRFISFLPHAAWENVNSLVDQGSQKEELIVHKISWDQWQSLNT